MDPLLIAVIYVWICSAGLCAVLALPRDKNPALWFILGLLFTGFAIIAVIALPNEET